MTDQRRQTMAMMLVAGSAARTMALVAQEYVGRHPGARVIGIDLEALVYDVGQRDVLAYDGPGEVLSIAPALADDEPREVRPESRKRALVSFLRRGPGVLRPALNLAFRIVGELRPVSPTLLALASDLLRRERVDVVITCNDGNIGTRSVLLAARRLGIPTMLIQEGSFVALRRARGDGYRWATWLRRRSGDLGEVYAGDTYGAFGHDRLLVASADYARRFRAVGIAGGALRVVGIPRFDALASARACRVAPSERSLVYVFQPFLKQGRVVDDALPHLLALIDGINMAYREAPFDFRLRAHPRADAATLDALKARLTIPFSMATGDMQEVLLTSSAAIGHYSTALLEALIIDMPVVCVPIPSACFREYGEAAKQEWFTRLGIACPTSPEEIALAILDALAARTSGAAVDRLDEESGPIDGRSAARVVDEIDVLIGV